MTLAEIASFVCTKVGQPDAASLAACQLFINSRASQIWDAAMWRESLAMVTVTTDPTDQTIAFLPQAVDRVIGVRLNASGLPTGSQTLPPMELSCMFQYDSSLWDNTGTPIMFTQNTPACIPRVAPGANFIIAGSAAFTSLAAIQNDIGAEIFFSGLDTSGLPFSFSDTLGTSQSGANFYLSTLGTVFANPMGVIFSCSKPVTENPIYLNWGNTIITLPGASRMLPEDKTCPVFPNIKLINPPASGVVNTLLVLAKRRFSPMVDPQSQFQLRGADSVLQDFAQADMLQRQRQYSKSQAMEQSAKEQLGIMLDVEKNQNASEIRIIPANIHGWYDVASREGPGKIYW